LELREYDQARQDYQQALSIFIELDNRKFQANIFLQMGTLSYLTNDYEQAHNNYKKAFQIFFMEFDDRNAQAIIHGQWGLLAVAEEQPDEAIQQLLKAWEIFNKFQDTHFAEISIRNISRIYQSNPSPQFLAQIAGCLGCSEAEVLELFGATGED
jgi:tetratricopeptide (TPR) repeat protein